MTRLGSRNGPADRVQPEHEPKTAGGRTAWMVIGIVDNERPSRFRTPDIPPLMTMKLHRLALGVTALAAATAHAQQSSIRGTLIVTNKTPATATIIDVASGRVLATVPTGNGPHEVVAAMDGSVAVVTDYGAQSPGNTLTVIDLGKREVARTIDLGVYRRPHGVVFLPGDTLVAVTSETNRAVIVVHVVTGAIVKAIDTEQAGSHMVGVMADGSRGFTGNIGSNTVSELDLRAGVSLRRFDVPAQPEAINVTPDGREVWVGSNATGKVSAIDVASGLVMTAAEGFGWPYRVLFTPDAATVLLPDYRGETLRFVERASRRELGRLSLPGAGPQGITLTPDARYAFLSLSQQGRVAIVDVARRAIVSHLEVGSTPDGVAYVPRVVAR
ncbi:MAG: YVTN family beta-propeller repeat protein [Gemmatimonadaceae bacterium]